MYGALAGDIAGSYYKSNNIKTKEFNLYHCNERLRFTDISVLNIAVSKSLIETKDNYFIGLEKSLNENIHQIGKRYPYCGYDRLMHNWIMLDGSKPYHSYDNGSAVRVSECGWVSKSLNETLKLADITTSVTHDHPEGIKGAQAIASCIFLARNGFNKEDIFSYIHENFYNLDFSLNYIRDSYKSETSCSKSVPQAIVAFLESYNFNDSLKNAISIGGESNAIASMTGSISEAFYGIPDETKIFVECHLDNYLLDILKKINQNEGE